VPQGGSCQTDAECSTAFCVDAVCCDSACDAPLDRCNLPGDEGVCSSSAAPASALSVQGLLAAAALLAVVAALALRRQRRV
jgi:MYXO-CTERM domain-containing protein